MNLKTQTRPLDAPISARCGFERVGRSLALAAPARSCVVGLLLLAVSAWGDGAGLGSADAGLDAGRVYLETARFEGTNWPAGWAALGAWEVRDGLWPPAQGSFRTYAVWNRETALENTIVEGWFELLSRDTRIGLVRRDISRAVTGADIAGSAGVLDAKAGTLAIHGAWTDTNAPPALVTVPIPFALELGREYRLALWKTDAGHHGFGVWDTVTGANGAVATARTTANNPGKQLDAPGFLFLEGAVRCTRLDFSTAYPQRPRLLVLGDSNSEGEALKPDYEERYCKLAANALGGSCVLAARGRETTRSLSGRLATDLDRFHPGYVLILLGTSDPTFEGWRDGLQPVLERIEARGAIPVLATIPPRESRVSFNRQVNSWVRASGRKYVDFARALGRDAEGLYWEPGLHHEDGIHPNVKGYRRMYERLRADVPELFDTAGPGLRTVRIPPAWAAAGAELRLPIEVVASGQEFRMALSVAVDPAYLRVVGIERGAGLPPESRIGIVTNSAPLGRWGVEIEVPAGRCLTAGTQEVLGVRLVAAARPPGGQTRVRIRDDPTPRLLQAFGVEAYRDGEVWLPTLSDVAGRWSLDGAAEDSSGHEQHGVLDGGRTVAGHTGEAVWLDGVGAHVALTNSSAAVVAVPFSLAAWVRSDRVDGRRPVIVGTTDGPRRVVLRIEGGQYQFGAAFGSGGEVAAAPVPARDAGRWVHLAGVFSGQEWRLFRNGLRVATLEAGADVPTSLQPVGFGAGVGVEDGYFAGALDEVRVYPRAVADWEIAQLAGLETPFQGTDEAWLEDGPPVGARVIGYGGDDGIWVETAPRAASGGRFLESGAAPGVHGYYFGGYRPGWFVSAGDRLVVDAWIDPVTPPRMILTQWQDDLGSWEHRAYWGENLWPFGEDTSTARHSMGALPGVGRWVRLEVPAAWVGLEGRTVRGLGLMAYDGAVRWDRVGVDPSPTENTKPVGVWIEDGLPPGVDGIGYGGDSGTWIESAPTAASGGRFLESEAAPGVHGYYFGGYRPGWAVSAGDSLVVHAWMDPLTPPRMILIQWQDDLGSWEHRAYWGESLWPFGEDTLTARHPMGALPGVGQWVRLEVPAARVGLEGRTVRGLGLMAYDGAVRWDRVGMDPSPTANTRPAEVWIEDALPPGANGVGYGGDAGAWVESAPTAASGGRFLESEAAPGVHGYYFGGYKPGWPVAAGDSLVAYVWVDPLAPPRLILMQWQDELGSWEHRAYWGEDIWPYGDDTPLARHAMGPLPGAGRWVRLEVPAAWVGLEGRKVEGLGLMAWDGAVRWDHVGVNRSAADVTWLTDALPVEAQVDPEGTEPWQWNVGVGSPFEGLAVHASNAGPGVRCHAFIRNGAGWAVEPSGSLFAWVQVQHGAEPDMLALEWRDESGNWDHRAFWGDDLLSGGQPQTGARRRLGAVPAAGQWTRLSAPVGLVGLDGGRVTGMRFVQAGGEARWSRAGASQPATAGMQARLAPRAEPWGDGVWFEFELNLPGQVAFEVSTNLLDWEAVETFAAAAGTNAVSHTVGAEVSPRFYRLLLRR